MFLLILDLNLDKDYDKTTLVHKKNFGSDCIRLSYFLIQSILVAVSVFFQLQTVIVSESLVNKTDKQSELTLF